MAIQLKINAQARTAAGRNAVKKLKAQGLVPAVIYGAKVPAQNLQIVERELSKLLGHSSSESFLVEVLVADGASRTALISEVQHHPVSGKILHVDLHAVAMDELLTAEVPVETTGEAVGVRTGGGVLEISLHELEIECLPGDLPASITVDVSELAVGQAIHVRDLKLPQGVTALNDADLTVVAVAEPTVSEEPTPAADAAAVPATAEKSAGEGAAAAATPAAS